MTKSQLLSALEPFDNDTEIHIEVHIDANFAYRGPLTSVLGSTDPDITLNSEKQIASSNRNNDRSSKPNEKIGN